MGNRGGEWPRLGGNATNATENAFYLRNMDYFRLKNIQLGYTLPKGLTQKFYVENLVCISVQKIFSLSLVMRDWILRNLQALATFILQQRHIQ